MDGKLLRLCSAASPCRRALDQFSNIFPRMPRGTSCYNADDVLKFAFIAVVLHEIFSPRHHHTRVFLTKTKILIFKKSRR